MKTQSLLLAININKAKISALSHLFSFCPNFPKAEYRLTETDMTIHTFTRHLLRVYYHSTNFINFISKIHTEILKQHRPASALNNQSSNLSEKENSSESFGTMVSDDIFFEFDAFIYSSKSIFEGKMHKRLKNIFKTDASEYNELSERIFSSTIRPVLMFIRNEVVHLNRFGTSFGSMAHVEKTDNGWKISLPSNYSMNGKQADLIELFLLIFDNINRFVGEIITMLSETIYAEFGMPEKEINFNCGNVSVKIPSFEYSIIPFPNTS